MASRKNGKSRSAKSSRTKSAKKTGPRQRRLPGTEDAVIQEIEAKAEKYIDGRDVRMAATKREVTLKTDLIAAMHKHGKQHYRHGDLDITLRVEKESVTVRRVSESGEQEDVDISPSNAADRTEDATLEPPF